MENPIQTETWYCWKELIHLEDEPAPRLFTPWSEPYVYEYPADWIFFTKEQAWGMKKEIAPDENWILCKITIEPLPPMEEDRQLLLPLPISSHS